MRKCWVRDVFWSQGVRQPVAFPLQKRQSYAGDVHDVLAFLPSDCQMGSHAKGLLDCLAGLDSFDLFIEPPPTPKLSTALERFVDGVDERETHRKAA